MLRVTIRVFFMKETARVLIAILFRKGEMPTRNQGLLSQTGSVRIAKLQGREATFLSRGRIVVAGS